MGRSYTSSVIQNFVQILMCMILYHRLCGLFDFVQLIIDLENFTKSCVFYLL